jgi:hypothetical protein
LKSIVSEVVLGRPPGDPFAPDKLRYRTTLRLGIRLEVDPDDVIRESNEANNVAFWVVEVPFYHWTLEDYCDTSWRAETSLECVQVPDELPIGGHLRDDSDQCFDYVDCLPEQSGEYSCFPGDPALGERSYRLRRCVGTGDGVYRWRQTEARECPYRCSESGRLEVSGANCECEDEGASRELPDGRPYVCRREATGLNWTLDDTL